MAAIFFPSFQIEWHDSLDTVNLKPKSSPLRRLHRQSSVVNDPAVEWDFLLL